MTYLRRLNGASLFAFVAALATVSERAEALQPQSPVVVSMAGQCVRSVDIAADLDSYYVVGVVGRCDNVGPFVVRLTKYSATTVSQTGFVDAFSSMEGIGSESLVRVSVGRGAVFVAVANREGTNSRLVLRSFLPNLMGPMTTGPTSTAAPVIALSLDCDAGSPGSPCVVAAIENTGLGHRAVIREGVTTTANVGPSMPMPADRIHGIAAVAGTLSVRGGVLSTNVLARPAVFFAAPVPSPFVNIEPTFPSPLQLLPAASALLLNDGRIGGVWSSPSSIIFGFGSTWSTLAYRRMASSTPLAAFTAEDAVQVGGTVLTVGRGGRLADLSNASAAFAAFPVVSGPAVVAVNGLSGVPIGGVRVATPNSCREAGRAVAAFGLASAGSTGANMLSLVPFSCSERTDCVDVVGTMGECSGGRCFFLTGPCAPDSGVDSGVDASTARDTGVDTGVNVSMDSGVIVSDSGIAPRDSGVPNDTTTSDVVVDRFPFDEGVLDAPVETDVATPFDADNDVATIDSSSTDSGGDGSTSSNDGSTSPGDGSSRPPTINGGACQCRTPSAPAQHRPHSALVLAAIASIVTVARRRSRAR